MTGVLNSASFSKARDIIFMPSGIGPGVMECNRNGVGVIPRRPDAGRSFYVLGLVEI